MSAPVRILRVIDLLVIKRGKYDRGKLTTAIYNELADADAPVVVIVVTPEDVERDRDSHCMVICPAIREGKVVYGAQTIAAGRSARVAQPGQKQSHPRATSPVRRLPVRPFLRRAAGG
jgi:hypothetical protein